MWINGGNGVNISSYCSDHKTAQKVDAGGADSSDGAVHLILLSRTLPIPSYDLGVLLDFEQTSWHCIIPGEQAKRRRVIVRSLLILTSLQILGAAHLRPKSTRHETFYDHERDANAGNSEWR